MLKLQITSKEYSLKENNVSVQCLSFQRFFCGLIDGYTILKGYCGALYATMHKEA